MIPDLDIYRSANVLVKRHGEVGPIQAVMGADAMLKKGELGGYGVWKQILRTVVDLGCEKPRNLGVGWSEYDRRWRVVVGSNCAKVRRTTELPAMSGRGHQPGPTRSKSTEIPKLVALR